MARFNRGPPGRGGAAGCPSFGYFSWASKKSDRAAGPLPANESPHIANASIGQVASSFGAAPPPPPPPTAPLLARLAFLEPNIARPHGADLAFDFGLGQPGDGSAHGGAQVAAHRPRPAAR